MECKNNSLVNKLENMIKDIRLDFRGLDLGKIDYRLLMNKPRIQVNQRVIDEYKKLNKQWKYKVVSQQYQMSDDETDEKNENNYAWLKSTLLYNMRQFGYSDSEIADMLVKEYYQKDRTGKQILWFCYGEYIVENLIENIQPRSTKIIQCVDCGEWFEVDSKNMTKCRCDNCQTVFRREWNRERMRKKRLI